MFDKRVRVTWVVIYLGWAAAFGIWLLSMILHLDDLGELSVLVGAVAATCTVREFFAEHDEAVKNIITVLNLGAVPPELEKEHTRLRPMK